MSQGFNQDLRVATVTLFRSGDEMESRVTALERKRSGIIRDRQAYLTETAERLLPAVNSAVLSSLRLATPGFITVEIEAAFKSQKKILGFYRRGNYNQALSLLQAQFASYLDQTKYGDLKSFDIEITRVSAQIDQLSVEMKEMLAMLRMLSHADVKRGALPDTLRRQVEGLSSKISKHKASKPRATSDDYSDLLIYLATDFPSSVRTLMLSSIENVQVNTESTRSNVQTFGGEAGGYSNTDIIESSSSFSNDSGISAGAAVGVGIGVAAAAVTGAVIATDDSKGMFS